MPEQPETNHWRQNVLLATSCFVQMMAMAANLYQEPNYWKQDYHTSVLSGHAWVQELVHGHPDRIYYELGMRLPVFIAFVGHLQLFGGLKIS